MPAKQATKRVRSTAKIWCDVKGCERAKGGAGGPFTTQQGKSMHFTRKHSGREWGSNGNGSSSNGEQTERSKRQTAAIQVGRYIDSLQQGDGNGNETRSAEWLQAKIDEIDVARKSATGMALLKLLQKRREYIRRLEHVEHGDPLLQGFIANAKMVATLNGIDIDTFREAGVKPAVLRAAGLDGNNVAANA